MYICFSNFLDASQENPVNIAIEQPDSDLNKQSLNDLDRNSDNSDILDQSTFEEMIDSST